MEDNPITWVPRECNLEIQIDKVEVEEVEILSLEKPQQIAEEVEVVVAEVNLVVQPKEDKYYH